MPNIRRKIEYQCLVSPTRYWMKPLFLAILLCVSSASGHASQLDDENLSDSQPNYLLPAVEMVGQHIFFNVYARLQNDDFAQITPRTMWNNLYSSWEIDEDAFITNQIGHPYQGSLYFTAARSSRVGFWGSIGYTFIGSLSWEYLMETERPSVNDLITTTIGGSLLGEVMHRLSDAIYWRDQFKPQRRARYTAAIVNPMGAFNHKILHVSSSPRKPPRIYATWSGGYGTLVTISGLKNDRSGEVNARDQLHFAFEATYGLPGDIKYTPQEPLDHFNVAVALDTLNGDRVGSIFIRSLIKGRKYTHKRFAGLWGLYAGQDFYTPAELRVGALSIGFGGTGQLRIASKSFLQSTFITSFVPLGAAGQTQPIGNRDYQLGPGVMQMLELRIGQVDTGLITLTSRNIDIDRPASGTPVAVSHNALSAELALWDRHVLGFGFIAAIAYAQVEEIVREKGVDFGWQARVYYQFTSDTSFGAGFR